jgi:hypothetical protein
MTTLILTLLQRFIGYQSAYSSKQQNMVSEFQLKQTLVRAFEDNARENGKKSELGLFIIIITLIEHLQDIRLNTSHGLAHLILTANI